MTKATGIKTRRGPQGGHITRFSMHPKANVQVQVEITSEGGTGAYKVYHCGLPKPFMVGSVEEPLAVFLQKVKEQV